MITGYGVAESVGHYYDLYSGDIKGKRAIIQGWGNVGAAAGYYLSQMGVKIVGIIDRFGGVLKPEGFSFEEIRGLYLDRNGNQLQSKDLIPFDEINRKIWEVGAEIFIPAAASRIVKADHLKEMINHDLEVIACGANVPFDDPEIFFGPTSELADSAVSVIPDFIANCGMAVYFIV
ncbi:MAG: hypothetical protein U0X76_07220 [Bacteroidia bacterium]